MEQVDLIDLREELGEVDPIAVQTEMPPGAQVLVDETTHVLLGLVEPEVREVTRVERAVAVRASAARIACEVQPAATPVSSTTAGRRCRTRKWTSW